MTDDPLAPIRNLQDLVLHLAEATGFDLVGFQLSPNQVAGGREMLSLTFEVPPPTSDEDPIRGMIDALMEQLDELTKQHKEPENDGD